VFVRPVLPTSALLSAYGKGHRAGMRSEAQIELRCSSGTSSYPQSTVAGPRTPPRPAPPFSFLPHFPHLPLSPVAAPSRAAANLLSRRPRSSQDAGLLPFWLESRAPPLPSASRSSQVALLPHWPASSSPRRGANHLLWPLHSADGSGPHHWRTAAGRIGQAWH
jgi:hypothetical protein